MKINLCKRQCKKCKKFEVEFCKNLIEIFENHKINKPISKYSPDCFFKLSRAVELVFKSSKYTEKLGLKNVFDCCELIENTDYSKIAFKTNQEIHDFGNIFNNSPFNQNPIEVKRVLDLHRTGLETQNSQNYKNNRNIFLSIYSYIFP